MVQLKFQRSKRVEVLLPEIKTLRIGKLCIFNEKWLIPGAL